MKFLIALCALAVAVTAEQYYDAKYDNFNAQDLVDSVRLLKAYGNCFLDKGPCTSEGSDFKRIIPEALRSSCGKCSPKQRQLVRTVVKGYQTKLPAVWEGLVKKHDPNNEFKESFNNFLNASD